MLIKQKLIDQLESLPLEDRAQVVDSLLRTLNAPDAEIDRAWAEAAQRRLNEMRGGGVEGVPADQVFARARQRFTK